MAPLLSFPLQSPPSQTPERLATLKVFGVHVPCPVRVCVCKEAVLYTARCKGI